MITIMGRCNWNVSDITSLVVESARVGWASEDGYATAALDEEIPLV